MMSMKKVVLSRLCWKGKAVRNHVMGLYGNSHLLAMVQWAEDRAEDRASQRLWIEEMSSNKEVCRSRYMARADSPCSSQYWKTETKTMTSSIQPCTHCVIIATLTWYTNTNSLHALIKSFFLMITMNVLQ